jgi:hypothetical protein
MAEYIRFRLTTAKVGVTMALMALIAGLAEKAKPASAKTPSSGVSFFNNVSNPLAGGLDHAVVKLQQTFLKIDRSLLKIEQAIKKSELSFVKIDARFHKDETSYLKIDAASQEFLKIDAASQQFLKIDAPATNADNLGGMPPSSFVQGHANVVSGVAMVSKGSATQTLLETADQLIVAKVSVNGDGVASLVLHNNAQVSLTAVVDPTAVESVALPAGQDSAPIVLGAISGITPAQLHIQILPAGSFNNVVTLTVSAEQPTTGGPIEVVGQMVDGSV